MVNDFCTQSDMAVIAMSIPNQSWLIRSNIKVLEIEAQLIHLCQNCRMIFLIKTYNLLQLPDFVYSFYSVGTEVQIYSKEKDPEAQLQTSGFLFAILLYKEKQEEERKSVFWSSGVGSRSHFGSSACSQLPCDEQGTDEHMCVF